MHMSHHKSGIHLEIEARRDKSKKNEGGGEAPLGARAHPAL